MLLDLPRRRDYLCVSISEDCYAVIKEESRRLWGPRHVSQFVRFALGSHFLSIQQNESRTSVGPFVKIVVRLGPRMAKEVRERVDLSNVSALTEACCWLELSAIRGSWGGWAYRQSV